MLKLNYLLLSLTVFIISCAPHSKVTMDTSDPVKEVPWSECGYQVGDHPCNFTLKNQHGEIANLYDFYGNIVVIDFSAMWCGPCAAAAREIQEVKESFEEQGFSYLTVIIDDASGLNPDENDCKAWADTYGITEPVLAGGRHMLDPAAHSGWAVSGWPTFYFINKDMIIRSSLRGFSSSSLNEMILDIINDD